MIADDLGKVRMATTDNYQGEENDIVILSLVRSNKEQKSGFVNIQNRVCVALSRAKHGLYVIGNMKMFADTNRLWKSICSDLSKRGNIGPHLTLRCANHPDLTSINVSKSEDFDQCPHGGCSLICNKIKSCGHLCRLICHPISHNKIKCYETCTKPRPINCNHHCPKLCWEICGPCGVEIIRTRSKCSHTIREKCGIDINSHSYNCQSKCGLLMDCGHKCSFVCHPEGHDASQHKCHHPCDRTRLCSHKCPKKCYETCGECMEMVVKTLSCGHNVSVPCKDIENDYTCRDKCRKKLPCGHNCTQLCRDVCDINCPTKVFKVLVKCTQNPKHMMQMCCSDSNVDPECTIPCKTILPCQHSCQGKCGDCYTVNSTKHVACKQTCVKRLDCNHFCTASHPCDSPECPPCSEPCAVVCSHGKCLKACGEACDPCVGNCGYSCSHFSCLSQCYEVHSLMPNFQTVNRETVERHDLCNDNCPLPLPCGHKCMGICGEKCPNICKLCNPEDFEKIAQLDDYSLSRNQVRFIELQCGHIFRDLLLDNYISSWEANNNAITKPIPSCPECGCTVMGVFRYRDTVLRCLEAIEPQRLFLRQIELTRSMSDSLSKGKAGFVVETLSSILKTQSKTKRYNSLNPLIYLLLGQSYIVLGQLREALIYLSKAKVGDSSPYIRRDAFISLAFYFLSGDEVTCNLSRVLIENLSNAKELLANALNCECAKDFSTIYSREDSNIQMLMENIDVQITKKTIDTNNRVAAQARNLQYQLEQMSLQNDNNRTNEVSVDDQDINNNQTYFSNASALHSAACKGLLLQVKGLVESGADLYARDEEDNTPLLCAVINRQAKVIQYLYPKSPWHSVNKSNLTFLDVILAVDYCVNNPVLEEVVESIRTDANIALTPDLYSIDPSHNWGAAKYFEKINCQPMDQLMDMTGIKKVKIQALELFYSIRKDMERPVKARISSKQTMNFLFLGNPGTGKTTVARIFSEILIDLGVREKGKFNETSGQALLQLGQSKASDLLKSSIPGVLFIDEVYQLDPKGNSDGRAITNNIMEATENSRADLTVIVAGYADDVREKWLNFNPGLSSRFPIEISFEDFNEKELRKIFVGLVRDMDWQIENYVSDVSLADSGSIVDVATIAARRLSRSANRKGFANARSARVMVERALRAASTRQKKEDVDARLSGKVLSPQRSTTLILQDIIGEKVDFYKSNYIQEFLAMTGLEEVKRSVESLLKLVAANYESELRGEGVMEVSLHRLFIGNPGTGKTTTAKLYGKILKEMNYLSNGDVILIGASKLIGEHVGSTSKKVNDIFDSAVGKVLVIDEAYMLHRTVGYGREAIDTIVERVQGGPGEDFAVILCGYEEDIMTMIRESNPGLARRFRTEDAFHFADYNDEQLVKIILEVSKKKELFLSQNLAEAAVHNVLAKQRAKPNFGNVGAINNLLDHAIEKLMNRVDRSKVDGRWELIDQDLFDIPEPNSAIKALNGLFKTEHILEHIKSISNRVKVQKNKDNFADRKKLLKNYVFTGDPGTGKTSVARAFGEVFHGLDLLSSGHVVECKAMELIGSYVGHTAPLVKSKMDEARGGVLFIDEAYGLHPSRSAFAKDAIETILSNMTDPKYEGNMIIILAGYEDDMNKLLQSNAGLYRRISEKLNFPSWDPKDCLTLLKNLCAKDEVELDTNDPFYPSLDNLIMDLFYELSTTREGWGNAGDVKNIYEKMCRNRDDRCDDNGFVEGSYLVDDVKKAFNIMFDQRPLKESYTDKKGPSSVEPSSTSFLSNAKSDRIISSFSNSLKLVDKTEEDKIYGNAEDDDLIWSALDRALAAMGYDIYTIRDILSSRDLPLPLVEFVSNDVQRPVDVVRAMLVSQCSSLLPNVVQLINEIEAEQLRVKLMNEAIARANEEVD